MKKIYITKALLPLLIVTGVQVCSQVGIGTGTPNAALDVESNNSGVLVPRVELTSTTTVAPVTNGTVSELVYNTATVNDVTPGFYYLSTDSGPWVRISTGPETASKWSLSGNADTNPTANFIGTTDSQDLSVRTSGLERIRITAGGDIGFGTGTTTPIAKFETKLTGNTNNAAIASFSRVGTGSLGNFRLFSGLLANQWNPIITGGDKALLFDNDENSAASAASGLVIAPWSTTASGIKIMENGNVGISESVPNYKLTIDSSAPSITANRRPYGGIGITSTNGTTHLEGQLGWARKPNANPAIGEPVLVLQAVEEGVAWRDVSIARDAGNVGIGTDSPAAKLDVTLTDNNPAVSIVNFSRVGTGSLGFFGLFSGLGLQNYNGLVTAGDKALIFDNDSNTGANANSGLVIGARNGGSAPNGIKIMENGNVGIGSTAPAEKLEVNTGNIFMNSTVGQHIRWTAAGSEAPVLSATRSAGTRLILNPQAAASSADYAMGMESNAIWQSVPQGTATFSHKFYGGASHLMTIRGDGRVGIGITAPAEKLEVNNGNIFMNSTIGQFIRWTTAGTGLPTISTFAISAGTRLLLSPMLTATTTNFAMGMESNASWQSLPNDTDSYTHKFYGGITPLMTIRGDGEITIGNPSTAKANLKLNGSLKLWQKQVGVNDTNDNVDANAPGGKDVYISITDSSPVTSMLPLASNSGGRVLYYTTTFTGHTITKNTADPALNKIYLNSTPANSIALPVGLTTLVCDGQHWYAK